jgi:hypothetical protein
MGGVADGTRLVKTSRPPRLLLLQIFLTEEREGGFYEPMSLCAVSDKDGLSLHSCPVLRPHSSPLGRERKQERSWPWRFPALCGPPG